LPAAAPIIHTTLGSRPPDRHGKVRDIYEYGDRLLIVATDRISAFDYVLGSGIPDKGKVLTQISAFWFERLHGIVDHHLLALDTESLPDITPADAAVLRGRSMLVKKTEPLPIEAIARGYLAGSGWKEYQRTGAICGVTLPSGLQEAQQLPQPIFTPSTKAPAGTHDENIAFAQAETLLGSSYAQQVRDKAIELYSEAARYARSLGIIIADTKFEFGTDVAGRLYLIDEALTPDSSRFWPEAQYRVGSNPPSFDKQYVRDWLEAQHWNKKPPAPALPADVLAGTAAKYREALQLLTGA
jgi:phosphoribosylaminoimidazole-succinocarboxamide synthase